MVVLMFVYFWAMDNYYFGTFTGSADWQGIPTTMSANVVAQMCRA